MCRKPARLHNVQPCRSPHGLNITHSSPLDLQEKRDNKRKKSICYSLHAEAVPNSLLCHSTLQILHYEAEAHMVTAEQNTGFPFCGKSPCFNTLFSPETVMESECLLVNLNSRSVSVRHFLNEEKQVDIFQAERLCCFWLNWSKTFPFQWPQCSAGPSPL